VDSATQIEQGMYDVLVTFRELLSSTGSTYMMTRTALTVCFHNHQHLAANPAAGSLQ
jgi:hypothetical protein